MTEYVSIRASEILDQHELVDLLKSRFGRFTKPLGRMIGNGTETVEARIPPDSQDFREIRDFIIAKRRQQQHGFANFTIGSYLRKYSAEELNKAEILVLTIAPHFEPCGEECGTIYKTLCGYCNLGCQVSDIALELDRIPQHKDMSQTIARIEWIVSSRFVRAVADHKLTGAEFLPILDFKEPGKKSQSWHQLRITGEAGNLSEKTMMGRDPFSPSEIAWRCPLGHSLVANFLSEIYLHRNAWGGSDIALTTSLYGQGRNLVRPAPLILISQRMYRTLRQEKLKGFSCEVAHLV